MNAPLGLTASADAHPVAEVSIDRFNETVGAELADAYSAFPGPALVIVSRTLKSLAREDSQPEVQHLSDSLKWLDREGYLKVEPYAAACFQATLTGRGLAILTTTPSSLRRAKKSLGEALVAEAKKGGREALGTLAKEAIIAGVKALGSMAAHHAHGLF
jgi:hypothetical protein